MNVPGIVFLDADTLGDVNFAPLSVLGNLVLYPSTPDELIMERIGNKEIIITNKVVINRVVMDTCPSIRLICIAATGMNNVDLKHAAEKGISVKNVSGYSTESVVQHTIALLLCLNGHLPYYDRFVKSGSYSAGGLFTHHGQPFYEIYGKTYGIIGMGQIGKRVALVAAAFGAEIIYYSTTQKNLETGYNAVSLNTLLSRSDIVSVHCPLNDATHDLIGYKQLTLMKKSAVIINAGRGGIINETDLARALDEGILSGAALDVISKEPPDADHPLLHLKHPERLLITPHIAWAAMESRERLLEGIRKNISEFLEQDERVTEIS